MFSLKKGLILWGRDLPTEGISTSEKFEIVQRPDTTQLTCPLPVQGVTRVVLEGPGMGVPAVLLPVVGWEHLTLLRYEELVEVAPGYQLLVSGRRQYRSLSTAERKLLSRRLFFCVQGCYYTMMCLYSWEEMRFLSGLVTMIGERDTEEFLTNL